MAKSLKFPGKENLILVSAYSLVGQPNEEIYLNWLRKNWVCLDEEDNGYPMYAKPYSKFDYKYKMKESLDDPIEDLQKVATSKKIILHKV